MNFAVFGAFSTHREVDMAKQKPAKLPKNTTFHGGGGSAGESVYEQAAERAVAKETVKVAKSTSKPRTCG
jgi:hypothetical protein